MLLFMSCLLLPLIMTQGSGLRDHFGSSYKTEVILLLSIVVTHMPYPASLQDCNSCLTVIEVIRQNQDLHAYQITELVYTKCEQTSLKNLDDFCLTVTADIDGYITQIKNGLADQQLCDLPMPDCSRLWPQP